MKKRSNDYWINRSNELLANIHQQSTPYVLEISKYYDKAIKDLQRDINKIFQVYANNHNLTRSEAKKLLNTKISTKEIEHLRKKISQISNDELRKSLLAQLNANAYRARISRLEALKQAIQIHYMEVADMQLTLSKMAYINTIEESYYVTAYNLQKGMDIGFNIAQIPEKTVDTILNTNWSGKLYSERIWSNSQTTIDSISETLTSGFVSGKSIPRMVKEIEELTDYGKYAAERLIRTETTFFANQGSIQSYKECEVEKYIFIATLDLRTSKECRKHDRKAYEVAKAMPGENLPPLHVFCRSTTRAYLGEKYMQDIQRRARDPVTGETYLVGNMNYEEWYNKYVKGNPQAEIAEKKLKNKDADKKQHSRYRELLGKDIPRAFDKFQELKYNDSSRWEELKANLKRENEKYKEYQFNKDGTIVITDDWKGQHISIPRKYKPYAVVETSTEFTNGEIQVDRTLYDKDGMMHKQIHSGNHNKPKQHPYGKYGEHMHYYKWNTETGRPERSVLELTEQEKTEHRDILKGVD